jgi:hypothetical protein
MTSPDAITWTKYTSAINTPFNAVEWSTTLEIFVGLATSGMNGQAIASHDGVRWFMQQVSLNCEWRGMCWSEAQGQFVAVGNNSGLGGCMYTGQLC